MATTDELKIKISVAFKKAQSALKQMSGKFKSFGKNLVKIAKRAGLAFAAMGTAMFAMGKSVANVGDNIAKMSVRLNLSVQDLAALQFQASLAGTDFEQAANGIRFMARTAFDANDGLKSAARGFDILGIKVADSTGKVKPSGELFLEIAEAMKKMEAGTKRMAAAQLIFGSRFGTGMIPLLIQGREELEKQAKEFERLGLIWSEKDAKAAEEFNDSLLRMESAFKGVTQAISKELFPVFIQTFKNMTALLVENRKRIKDFVVGIGSMIKESFKFVQRNKNLILSLIDLAFVLSVVGTSFAVITGNIPLAIVSLGILTASSQAVAATIATIKITEFGEKLVKASEEANKMADSLKKIDDQAKKLDNTIKLTFKSISKPPDLTELVKVSKEAFQATGVLGDEFLKLRTSQIAQEKIIKLNAAQSELEAIKNQIVKIAALQGEEGEVFKAIKKVNQLKMEIGGSADRVLVESAREANKELIKLQKDRVKKSGTLTDKWVASWTDGVDQISQSFEKMVQSFPANSMVVGINSMSQALLDSKGNIDLNNISWKKFSQAFLTEINKMIAKAIALAIINFLSKGTSSLIEGVIKGFFADGTPFVPETGLAMVHRGERIIPAADNKRLMKPTINNNVVPFKSLGQSTTKNDNRTFNIKISNNFTSKNGNFSEAEIRKVIDKQQKALNRFAA